MPLRLSTTVILAYLSLSLIAPISLSMAEEASSQMQAKLSHYEEALFHHDFAKLTTNERLDKIETSVFGTPQSGNESERLERLANVLKRVMPYHQKAASPKDTQHQAEGPPWSSQQKAPPAEEAPTFTDATDYPKITAVEKKLYRRSFTHQDITTRLDRLEYRLFKTTFPDMSLSDRVDKIAHRVPTFLYTQPRSSSPHHQSNLRDNRHERRSPRTASIHDELDSLEHQYIGFVSEGKLITERLDSLERVRYGHTYTGSVNTRLLRLKRPLQQKPRFASPTRSPGIFEEVPSNLNDPLGQGASLPSGAQRRINQQGQVIITETTTTFPQGGVRPQAGFGGFSSPRRVPGYSPFSAQPPVTGFPNGFPPSMTSRPGIGTGIGTTRTHTRTYIIAPNNNVTTIPHGAAGGNTGVTRQYVFGERMMYQLQLLEEELLGKEQPNQPLLDRLSLLEQQKFQRTYPNDPPQMRLLHLVRGR